MKNKYQEVLFILEDNNEYLKDYSKGDDMFYYRYSQGFDAIEELRELVDKETPMKPDIEGDGYADGELVYDTWVCPNCGEYYEIECDIYDYCPKCGQHIDRSELKEYE